MVLVVDTNILIYAAEADSTFHDEARTVARAAIVDAMNEVGALE